MPNRRKAILHTNSQQNEIPQDEAGPKRSRKRRPPEEQIDLQQHSDREVTNSGHVLPSSSPRPKRLRTSEQASSIVEEGRGSSTKPREAPQKRQEAARTTESESECEIHEPLTIPTASSCSHSQRMQQKSSVAKERKMSYSLGVQCNA